VRTSTGLIETTVVAVCCGVWSPRIARMAGATIPLTPIVHQMISVGPVPLFADTVGEISYPIIRDMDTNMYERQHGGDLEVGSYAHRPIVVSPDEIPSIEQSVLSPTELPFTQEDFDPQLEEALELMPELLGNEKVGVRYAINGLISMTPDGHPVLGETPEVRGLWSVAASWIKEGPGIARTVAQWMDGQVPDIDLHESDIARFYPHQRTRAHVAARAEESFNKMYGIVHPAEQYESQRPTRRSPVFDQEWELGAVFFETVGWERPYWYDGNEHLLERYGDRVMNRSGEWESRWWSPIINAEHLAMRDGCGLVDLSAFVVLDVTGPGALAALQRLCVAQMNVAVGRVVYTSLLNEQGGFKSDLTIMRLGAQHFRVVTGGSTGMAEKKWFRDHLPADGSAQLSDLTSAWTTFGLWGPNARHVLGACTDDDVTNEGFAFGTCREIELGGVSGAGLAHLLRRRAGLGDLRADRGGRGRLGHDLAGRSGIRHRARRHRRLRDDRSAGEGLSRLRQRAHGRLQPRRGGHGPSDAEEGRLHRTRGLPRPAGRGARRAPVHAHCRRPPLLERGAALHARRRAGAERPGRSARRREGPALYVTSAGSAPSLGQHILLAYLPADKATARREAEGRLPRRALPGHGRRRGVDAALRPRERTGQKLGR
jgi:glycine cleavage system aminomethyltransferase T